jgi:hypothetical protein
MKTLATTPITPDDLLDAARTIPLGNVATCDWLSHWIPATVLLQWAERGLDEGEAYGLSNAVTYAKRAVACRIDVLVHYNHLLSCARSVFPDKIIALRQVGLSIPDVVRELVIDPRNALEHHYEIPSQAVARRAVGIADLVVRATDAECQRSSIVAVAWNVLGSLTLTSEREFVHFRAFSDRPMLFIDVFDEPYAAKIIDPKNSEIRSANLSTSLTTSRSHSRGFCARTTRADRSRSAALDVRTFKR